MPQAAGPVPGPAAIQALTSSRASRSATTVPIGGIWLDGSPRLRAVQDGAQLGPPGVHQLRGAFRGRRHHPVTRLADRRGDGVGRAGRRPVGGVLQEQAERRDRALRVVAAAAVGRQVAEHRALPGIARRDAGRGGQQLRPRRRQPRFVDQRLQGHHLRGQRFGVRRQRVAVGGELQRGEAEDLGAARVVAGAALLARGDAVPLARRDLGHRGDALGGGQHRVALVLGPRVGGELPAIGRGLHQQPGLDLAAAELELLPEPRPDREVPVVQVAGVDGGAIGQPHPAALDGAVAPQRVLRRERAVGGIDGQDTRVGVEAGRRQPLGQREGRHPAAAAGRQLPAGERAPEEQRAGREQRPAGIDLHWRVSGGSIGCGTRFFTGGSDCR